MKTGILRALSALAILPAAFAAAQTPRTFGTTATSYVYVGAAEFHPEGPSTVYDLTYKLTVPSGGTFTAQPQLPSGALLTEVQWDFCDADGGTSPGLIAAAINRQGDSIGGVGYGNQPISAGCTSLVMDLTAVGLVIDNSAVHLDLQIAATDPVEIVGARIGYKLQVSPAPPTATFGDVPTSDFGFQYVEALVAAGITGGCGNGNYCPDNPVTRRQMAIFIAKALGLQWP
jgi:hypothetical protein